MALTFFEILTGQQPFHGKSDMAVVLAVVESNDPSESASVSKQLSAEIRKAWSQDRDERPSMD